MAKKNHIGIKAFAWTALLTTLFVLTLGAVLIALVMGDWIMLKTANSGLAWLIASFVLLGYLSTLGVGIGFWLWARSPKQDGVSAIAKTDTMDVILAEFHNRD